MAEKTIKYKISDPDVFECKICRHQQLNDDRCEICGYDIFEVKQMKKEKKVE